MPYTGNSQITAHSTTASLVRALRRIRDDIYETPLIQMSEEDRKFNLYSVTLANLYEIVPGKLSRPDPN